MRRAGKFAVALLAGVGLLAGAGCAHYEPRPLAPETAAADFEARSLADAGLKQFVQANLSRELPAWPLAAWDFDALALAAFYFHPDLDAARARWDVAQAGQITAGERPNPTATLQPGHSSGLGPPWMLGLNFIIPIAQARQLTDAARLNLATVAWQVRGRVRRSVLDLQAAREMEQLLAQQQAMQAAMVKVLEDQLAAGAVSRLEVARASTAIETTRLAVVDAQQQAAEARAQLAAALGVPARALADVNLVTDTAAPPPLPAAEVRWQALLNRADILGALAEYAAAQSALQLEIARQYPDVQLGPGYQLDQDEHQWRLGFTATLPVFNQNQGAIAQANARRTEAATRFTALQAGVVADIDRALATYHAVQAKTGAADALLARLRQQEELTRAMIAAGEAAKPALLTVQLEFLTAHLARLDAQVKARLALAALEDAVQGPLTDALQTSPRAAIAAPVSVVKP
jgi:outer membrane protein, heavy metal efflux system